MIAVLDTNVIISAVLVRGSLPDEIVRAAERGRFQIATSVPLLHELETVIRRRRIQGRLGWSDEEVAAYLHSFAANALINEPLLEIAAIAKDPSDNRVLEAAIAGQAEYIVSGDNDLLTLASYEAVQIVSPARFLAILSTTES